MHINMVLDLYSTDDYSTFKSFTQTLNFPATACLIIGILWHVNVIERMEAR